MKQSQKENKSIVYKRKTLLLTSREIAPNAINKRILCMCLRPLKKCLVISRYRANKLVREKDYSIFLKNKNTFLLFYSVCYVTHFSYLKNLRKKLAR